MRALGMVLVVVGLMALAYQGFTYFSRTTVVEAGPVRVTAGPRVPVAPIVGGVALLAGGALLFLGGREARV